MKAFRRFALNAVLATAVTFVAFVCAELTARWILPPPAEVLVCVKQQPGAEQSGAGVPVHIADHPEDGGVYVETPSGRRLRPNLRVVIDNHRLSHRRIEITTNSLGFRNRELGPKEGTRILFLGNSVTFADYLPEEETFVRLVEKTARDRGNPWETVNAGVGAISLQDEIALLVERGTGVRPDVAVICFYLNDVFESPGVEVIHVPAPFSSSYLVRHAAHALPSLLFALTGHGNRMRSALKQGIDLREWRGEFAAATPCQEGDYRRDSLAFNRLVLDRFYDWGSAWSPHAWERIPAMLRTCAALGREHGFRVMIVAFPVRQQVEAAYSYDYPQRQIRRAAGELGVPVLDLLPLLRHARAADTTRPLFYDHCHHTPEASALIASAVCDFLAANLDDRTVATDGEN